MESCIELNIVMSTPVSSTSDSGSGAADISRLLSGNGCAQFSFSSLLLSKEGVKNPHISSSRGSAGVILAIPSLESLLDQPESSELIPAAAGS